MPRNGSGTYSLPEPPFVAGTTISSAAVNDDFSDIATALTGSLPRDGQAGMVGQFKASDGSLALPGIAFTNDLNTGLYRPGNDQLAVVVGGVQVALFNSGGLQGTTPIGAIIDYGGSSAPTLWVLCYGQNISRVTYAALFAIIGTSFGSGDGATTFGVPDLRGRTCYGRDDMGGSAASRLTATYFGSAGTTLGNGGGSESRQLITSNLPAYTPAGSVGISDPGHFHNGTISRSTSNIFGGANTMVYPGSADSGLVSFVTNSSATGITAGFTGSAQGGSSALFAIASPGLIVNKIMFAGA